MKNYMVSIGNTFTEDEVTEYQRKHGLATPEEAAQALWLEWGGDNWDSCGIEVSCVESEG